MTIDEAARELADCHARAPERKKVAAIHLFAICRAKEIDGMGLKELAIRAGLPETYGTELRKGVNIAPYVSVTARPWD